MNNYAIIHSRTYSGQKVKVHLRHDTPIFKAYADVCHACGSRELLEGRLQDPEFFFILSGNISDELAESPHDKQGVKMLKLGLHEYRLANGDYNYNRKDKDQLLSKKEALQRLDFYNTQPGEQRTGGFN